MTAKTDSRTPSGYLVFNTSTGGWKVYPREGDAVALTRRWNQLRMFTIYGKPEIDDKFIGLAKWATAA